MSATFAPFGLRAVYHPSGVIRPKRYQPVAATQIASGVVLYNGAPCALDTSNYIKAAAAGADWLGVIAGCDYIDPTGKPVTLNYVPAGSSLTGCTNINIWVLDDPNLIFETQINGTLAATALGDELTTIDGTYTASSGSALTGLSTMAFTTALAGAGTQGLFQITDISPLADGNAWGDAYVVVQGKIARSQLQAVRTAV